MELNNLLPTISNKIFNRNINPNDITNKYINNIFNNIKKEIPNKNFNFYWYYHDDEEWATFGIYTNNDPILEGLDEQYFMSSDGEDLIVVSSLEDNIKIEFVNSVLINAKDEKEFLNLVYYNNLYDIFGFTKYQWEQFTNLGSK